MGKNNVIHFSFYIFALSPEFITNYKTSNAFMKNISLKIHFLIITDCSCFVNSQCFANHCLFPHGNYSHIIVTKEFSQHRSFCLFYSQFLHLMNANPPLTTAYILCNTVSCLWKSTFKQVSSLINRRLVTWIVTNSIIQGFMQRHMHELVS